MPRESRELPQGPRPDLAVVDVSGHRRQYSIPDFPRLVRDIYFVMRVVNLGPGDFDGSVGFSFTDNWYDIDHDILPHLGGLGEFRMDVGDTIEVSIIHNGAYPPDTPFRFHLRTDGYPLHTFEPAYWFGREPVPEVSLENNMTDIILR
jgi:hypothetical protein